MFGASCYSARTAADSWPHPGLVELPNVVDVTRCGDGLPRLGFSDIRCPMDLEVPAIVADYEPVKEVVCGLFRREPTPGARWR